MSARRDLIVRELVKASANAQAAYDHALQLGDRELAASIREIAVRLGVAIANVSRPRDQRIELLS